MKWIRKAILILWASALILIGMYYAIDWDSLEQRRVERRVHATLQIQSDVLDVLVTGFKENAEIDVLSDRFLYRVFKNGELVRWSDNKALPAYSLLRQQDSIHYLEHASGKYIVQKRIISDDGEIIEFFSLLRLEEKFQILNNFLRDIFNPEIFTEIPRGIALNTNFPIHYKGDIVFGIIPSGSAKATVLAISVWMLLLSLPMTIAYTLVRYRKISEKQRYLFISVGVLIGIWGLLHKVDFPGRWLHSPIFDELVYSSSIFNITLGDTLITYAFLILVAGIINSQLTGLSDTTKNWKRILWILFLISMVYLNIKIFHWLSWDLMEHSQISFDITDSIAFDFTRVIAFFIIVLAAVFYFLINHALARWIALSRPSGGIYLFFHIITLVVFIKLEPDLFPIFVLQFAWYWIMYLADFSLRFEVVKKIALEYVLSIAALLALAFAFAVYQFHEANELESKKRFANKLVLEKDVLGEYYLNKIIDDFRNDEFIAERIEGGIFARQNVRERVRRQFVSSYFDKYELKVFLFDSDSVQLDIDGESYGNFLDKYAISDFKTDYRSIYLVDDTENIALKKYACLFPIAEVGFIAIELNRKKNVSTSVFPELLVESKYEQEGNNIFDYTIFRDSTVLYGQGRFGHVNYLLSQDLGNEELYQKGISRDGRHFLGKYSEDGRIIVIASSSYPNRSWVVNFSFIFLLLILLISFVGIFYRLVLNYQSLTLANKIQLYLALGFLIPLFVTGFTLLNTLNDSYRDEITRSYLKKSLRISENLVDETIQYANNVSDLNTYANYVGNASRFVEADLNIYSTDGKLITTSQPGVFGLGLLSDHINPVALEALTTDNQNIIIDESIGLLDFKATYTTISGYSDGQLYGIVALPFFDSKNHLRRQQKEVFADLLMIFALIFLFALISGNYVLNYLIGPLTLVSDHIKRTTLEVDNQPIDYSSDDEIGVLVKEYNKMLLKLERNKEALARSQKESAWKEIARQVAHEIKNPLTPMRLKIQQLQRDLRDDRQVRLLDSIITQIDTLSDIADSFSEFAKMPVPENTDFDVVQVVAESVRLHRSKQVNISSDLPSSEIIVWADPNILGRIMNNLLLNAIQSVKDGEVELTVNVALNENKVDISCNDNGAGIPDEIKEKIFTTYFSTKITGSGIGLAIAKKGIENAGGNIWFESTEGVGTTFYISLPVYEAV